VRVIVFIPRTRLFTFVHPSGSIQSESSDAHKQTSRRASRFPQAMATAQPRSLWQKSTLASARQNQPARGRSWTCVRPRASRGRQGACSHSGPGWYGLWCVSGRVKVRVWQRVVSTNDLPCRGHWAIHLEQQQAVSKWEGVESNGEDGDEHSSLRMSPGRNMDEVTIFALYGGPFQRANKSLGVKIEGNMRTLKS